MVKASYISVVQCEENKVISGVQAFEDRTTSSLPSCMIVHALEARQDHRGCTYTRITNLLLSNRSHDDREDEYTIEMQLLESCGTIGNTKVALWKQMVSRVALSF